LAWTARPVYNTAALQGVIGVLLMVGSVSTGGIFDSHVHVGRWVLPDFRGHSTSLEQSAAVLASSGIDGALVMPTDSGDNAGLIGSLASYAGPVRFAVAAWAIPDDSAIGGLLDAHDFRAVKIHPSFCRVPVNHDSWSPAISAARQRGLPVIVHCGRWQEMAGYGLLLQAADAWPDVKFVMAHMGGDSPSLVLSAAVGVASRGLRNVFMGTESIREYWIVAEAIGIVGADRVLFGSDHNLNSPVSFLAVIDAIGLDEQARSMVLGGNARKLFGIDNG